MAEIDLVWTAFGLFLLACGGVPAAVALVGERRGQPARPGTAAAAPAGRVAALFHEDDRGAAPAELERVRGIRPCWGSRPCGATDPARSG